MFRCRFARTAACAALFGVLVVSGSACSRGDPCTIAALDDVSSWPDPVDIWNGLFDPQGSRPSPTLPPKKSPAAAAPDYVEGCWDCAVRCSLLNNEAVSGETMGGSSQSYDAACTDAIRSLRTWAHTVKGSDLARCDYAPPPAQ
jgi:hypothetical protein